MKIIERLESLRGREHEATCALIAALVECERTKAYLDAGHASVWDLLVRRLKYSPAAASRRNAAMRFALASPRVLPMLRAHRTNLTALAKAVSLLRSGADADEVLDAIVDKSAEGVERAIAAWRPWTRPKERVRRVVVPARGEVAGSPVDRGSGARVDASATPRSTANASAAAPRPTATAPVAAAPDMQPSPNPVLTSAAEPREHRVVLTFGLDEVAYAKFERAKAILSRKLPAGVTLEQAFGELVDFYLEKKAPKDRAPAKAKSAKRTRHVPAATRDHVLHRDAGRCTFVAADGTRCESTHDVQIDHVLPYARGGSHDASNLRVLCAKHNRRRTERGESRRSRA